MSNYELKFWEITSSLLRMRDITESKDYVLGLICYKFMSEKEEILLNNYLNGKLRLEEAYKDDKLKMEMEKESLKKLGYFIPPKLLYSNLIRIYNHLDDYLKYAFEQLDRSSFKAGSQDNFYDLFDNIDLKDYRKDTSEQEIDHFLTHMLQVINEINFKLEENYSDSIGDAYEYLISKIAPFIFIRHMPIYTPPELSTIIARIVTYDKSEIEKIYDPACGSGSLLLRVNKQAKVSKIYGQEKNREIYNITRMNMIVHNIGYERFDIKLGDTLEKPQHINQKFDIIVSNPPISSIWNQNNSFDDDERFTGYGKLAPKSKAEYAFIEHMLYHLSDKGIMAVALPFGVLFRGAAEKEIRERLITEYNCIDTVIKISEEISLRQRLPECILVFKKSRKENEGILFIDASEGYKKSKYDRGLPEEYINKIVETYAQRKEIKKYSHLATIDEIRDNDYNLNISRYVDRFEEESKDIKEIVKQLKETEREIEEVEAEIIRYCEEMGVEVPFIIKK